MDGITLCSGPRQHCNLQIMDIYMFLKLFFYNAHNFLIIEPRSLWFSMLVYKRCVKKLVWFSYTTVSIFNII
jgi:hypothetical protein